MGWGAGVGRKETGREHACERETPAPWPIFPYVSPPPGLPCVNWASQECCLFYLRSVLLSSNLPLFYFLRLFPSLSFSHHHSGLPFSYSTYNFSLKRWEAQFFGNRGIEVFLVTSSWTGTARGIGPPPFASLRPQSPYSSVYLKVGDIFCGRL